MQIILHQYTSIVDVTICQILMKPGGLKCGHFVENDLKVRKTFTSTSNVKKWGFTNIVLYLYLYLYLFIVQFLQPSISVLYFLQQYGTVEITPRCNKAKHQNDPIHSVYCQTHKTSGNIHCQSVATYLIKKIKRKCATEPR